MATQPDSPPATAPARVYHGRLPPHVPTEESRAIVALYGSVMTNEMLARKMGIAESTLKKHYAEELFSGKFDKVAAVTAQLFKDAMKGNTTAQLAILRQFGGWTDNKRVELTGAGGGPVQIVDLSQFLQGRTADELAIIEGVFVELAASAVEDEPGDAGGLPPSDP